MLALGITGCFTAENPTTFECSATERGCPDGYTCNPGTWTCVKGSTKQDALVDGPLADIGKDLPAGSIYFADDFSKDKGWTSTHPTNIYRNSSTQLVKWHIKRSETRRMSIQMSKSFKDFLLEFDIKFDYRSNNCWLAVGTASSLIPKDSWFPGAQAGIFWHGGGCSNTMYMVETVLLDKQGTRTQSFSGYTCSGSKGTGYLEIEQSKWYRVTLQRKNGKVSTSAVRLGTSGSNQSVPPVGTTEVPDTNLNPLKYLVIGLGADTTNDDCYGELDNVSLTAE